ncbi:MAG: hypothetical protein ACRDBO_06095 [Lachnospiraceae bacterium]
MLDNKKEAIKTTAKNLEYLDRTGLIIVKSIAEAFRARQLIEESLEESLDKTSG